MKNSTIEFTDLPRPLLVKLVDHSLPANGKVANVIRTLARLRMTCRSMRRFVDSSDVIKVTLLQAQLPFDFLEAINQGRIRLVDLQPALMPLISSVQGFSIDSMLKPIVFSSIGERQFQPIPFEVKELVLARDTLFCFLASRQPVRQGLWMWGLIAYRKEGLVRTRDPRKWADPQASWEGLAWKQKKHFYCRSAGERLVVGVKEKNVTFLDIYRCGNWSPVRDGSIELIPSAHTLLHCSDPCPLYGRVAVLSLFVGKKGKMRRRLQLLGLDGRLGKNRYMDGFAVDVYSEHVFDVYLASRSVLVCETQFQGMSASIYSIATMEPLFRVSGFNDYWVGRRNRYAFQGEMETLKKVEGDGERLFDSQHWRLLVWSVDHRLTDGPQGADWIDRKHVVSMLGRGVAPKKSIWVGASSEIRNGYALDGVRFQLNLRRHTGMSVGTRWPSGYPVKDYSVDFYAGRWPPAGGRVIRSVSGIDKIAYPISELGLPLFFSKDTFGLGPRQHTPFHRPSLLAVCKPKYPALCRKLADALRQMELDENLQAESQPRRSKRKANQANLPSSNAKRVKR